MLRAVRLPPGSVLRSSRRPWSAFVRLHRRSAMFRRSGSATNWSDSDRRRTRGAVSSCSTRPDCWATFCPEIAAMKGVEQPPEYHPEGDVWTHTLIMLEGLRQSHSDAGAGSAAA